MSEGSSKDTKGEGNSRGDRVRNLCIMAHVDHGKTTLADSLIATNGIISETQAGSIKYMDSRPDEMERGITMKSSCITLAYPHQKHSYLINLVDSPGHVDFSSEVSTAVRLCDGCLLVVDVVEGVCAQTKAVMRQAWVAGVKPVLVLNKLDRLVLEQGMSSLDAYYHLAHVLQQVNAYMGELYNTDVLGRTNMRERESSTNCVSSPTKTRDLADWTIEDIDDSDLYFNPIAGNVVFASAIDGWGFGIAQFAEQFSSKLGMSYQALIKTLWGDYFISNKGGTKRIMKGARDKRKNPLFVTLVLDNLYQLYSKVRPATADIEEIKKIAASLSVTVPQRMFDASSDSKSRFTHICSSWLPLSKAVLTMVVDQLPAPTGLSEERAKKLLTTATHDFAALPRDSRDLVSHMRACSNADTAPLVVYVSKMFGVEKQKLRDAEKKLSIAQAKAAGTYSPPAPPAPHAVRLAAAKEEEQQDSLPEDAFEEEELLAFARVFSGSLRSGQEVYVFGPKYSPAKVLPLAGPDGHLTNEQLDRCPYVTRCKIGSVFLLLGREVQCLASAGAGLMVGVSGLTQHVIKSASLSDTLACPPFSHVLDSTSAVGMAAGGDPSGPILRVQVLPKNPRFLGKLREGLKLLNQADPCVQVWLESSGEYMVGAAGEVHLQRCLADLEERYARTPVTASAPIVPFRETVVPPPTVDRANEAIQTDNTDNKNGSDTIVIHDGELGSLHVRAVPLPPAVTELLYKSATLLSALATRDSDRSSRAVSLHQPHGTQHSLNDTSQHTDDTNSKQENVDSEMTDVNQSTDILNETSQLVHKRLSDDDCNISQNDSSEQNITESDLVESINNLTTENNIPSLKAEESLESVKNSIRADSPNALLARPCSPPSVGGLTGDSQAALAALRQQLTEAFDAAGPEWLGVVDQIWCCGPQECGPNLLINRAPSYVRPSVWQPRAPLPQGKQGAMDHGIVTGFQLATTAGSLCEEPLMGVAFVVEKWEAPADDDAPLLPGKVLSVAKELLFSAVEKQPRRMMVAMYSCVVTVTQEVVGRVYSVLGKRHGRILHGDITEGSTSWNVTALMPIVESIDFANELRKATSGEAQPQLVFSHWEILDQDPYWDPCTAEELIHFGEKADTDNLARQYMNAVRKRKGIKEYGKQLVEFGEKQRTLTKNK